MKVLNLVWNEYTADYYAEQHLFGSDESPEVDEMLFMINEKYPRGKTLKNDLSLSAKSSRHADEIWKDIIQYCSEHGYVVIEVPEVTINISN